MLYILIRICVRDDYIGALAYYSLKKVYPDAKYIFLAEIVPKSIDTVNKSYSKLKFLPIKNKEIKKQSIKNYMYIYQTGASISFRPFCDNFGGQSGVRNIIQSMQKLNLDIKNDDYVFLVDSDIVMYESCLNELVGYDHCGCLTEFDGLTHISGQYQIMSSKMYKLLIDLNDNQIEHYIQEMTSKNISIADDTFISYMSDIFHLKKKQVCKWVHIKFYEYTGNINFEEVIEKIKSIYPINATRLV